MKTKTFFIVSLLLYLIGIFSTVTASSPESSIYKNSVWGYEIAYPRSATLEYGKDSLKGFYFDPVEFVAGSVEINSLVKITYTPNQYLVVVLVKKPLSWPIGSAKPVKINRHIFYMQHRQEAGMCHFYDYYMYWLRENDRYYVFVFLYTTDCFAKPVTTHEEAARVKEMKSILESFKEKN